MVLPWAGPAWTSSSRGSVIGVSWPPWRSHQAPEATGEAGPACPLTMLSTAGSTKPALALLCYMATWLSMLANPISGPSLCDTKMILENLQFGVGTLAEHYELDEKTGLPQHPAGRPALPCFTPGPQAANNISVLRAYVKKVKELIQPANQTAMEAILKQLQDLQYEDTPEPHVSEPLHENFAKKMFIKAVFQEFSTCVNTSYSAFKARLKEEGRHCVHK